MTHRQDVILGAGLAGLTAAYTLGNAGEDYWQVYEKEARVGGHARSVSVDGYVFDFGPHILFAADAEIEALIRELLGDNFLAQHRRAFIYHNSHKTYTRFPFQAHLYGLPVPIVSECIVGLIAAIEKQARGECNPRNYEEWMRGFFGDAIAERLMIPYARKLWTVEPDVMDFSWIGARVPTPSVERIVVGALTNDVGQVGATREFWYPKRGGIEALARSLGERVANVHLDSEVERIDLRSRTLTLCDGERVPFSRMIYSLPLCQLSRYVSDLPPDVAAACRGLRYQGIYCVNLGVARENISDKHWVYFYEEDFPFHRLSFPANFSSENVPPGRSSISTEIAFPMGERPDERLLVERTISALKEAEILRDDDRIELVHTQRIAPAYVIYDLDHRRQVDSIRSWLEDHGVFVAGRFGEWQYFNMDQAMRSGMDVARSMVGGRQAAVA